MGADRLGELKATTPLSCGAANDIGKVAMPVVSLLRIVLAVWQLMQRGEVNTESTLCHAARPSWVSARNTAIKSESISLRSRLDHCGDCFRVRQKRHVARPFDFGGLRPHPLGVEAQEIGVD